MLLVTEAACPDKAPTLEGEVLVAATGPAELTRFQPEPTIGTALVEVLAVVTTMPPRCSPVPNSRQMTQLEQPIGAKPIKDLILVSFMIDL